jgi:hypothetical protein
LAIDAKSLVGTITWSRGLMGGRKTVLATFNYPYAKGKSNFKNAWLREIPPSVSRFMPCWRVSSLNTLRRSAFVYFGRNCDRPMIFPLPRAPYRKLF